MANKLKSACLYKHDLTLFAARNIESVKKEKHVKKLCIAI